MRQSLFLGILYCILFQPFETHGELIALKKYPDSIDLVISAWHEEILQSRLEYELAAQEVYMQLSHTNIQLKKEKRPNEQLVLLLYKDRLKEKLLRMKQIEEVNLNKIKYIKGLQIIKILYEKSLALDHHFSSVVTFNDINKLSNPNQYPEFTKIKEITEKVKKRKQGFELSSILGDNIYVSVAHSIVSLFTNTSTTRDDKNKAIEDVECILDFTLRMQNELSTIYFETEFLKRSNENMTKELEQLFVDYTKPINYDKSLSICRTTDNWDEVRKQLGDYLEKLTGVVNTQSNPSKAYRMQVDLEFPVERLLQFIVQYNLFIEQGTQFYEKFSIMLSSYENVEKCSSKIPVEFNELKDNVNVAIQKFHTAYKPVEINGSKMKEILYGLTEYD